MDGIFFFDITGYLPYKTYPVKLKRLNTSVVSEGSRTKVILSDAIAENFPAALK